MDELEGRRLKTALLREEVADEAWEQLLPYADSVLKAIRSYFSRYTGAYDHQDCEDVLNTTFAQVVINFEKYSPNRPLLPWVKRIAHNEVVNLLRSKTKRKEVSYTFDLADESSPGGAGAGQDKGEVMPRGTDGVELSEDETSLSSYTYDYGDDVELAENVKSRIVQQELADLTDQEQALLIDHYGNGIPLADLARRNGISELAMRKRAERTRSKFYKGLVRHEEFRHLNRNNVPKTLPSK
jgi:RNA polymerase sigma factor (sigma-70 family)